MESSLRGSFWVFILYDICEEIRLDDLRQILGTGSTPRQPSFKHPAPDYVKFERSPVVQQMDKLRLESGEEFECRLKYFDYGVVSVELELRFEANWDRLVRLSSRWITAPELEKRSSELVRSCISKFGGAIVQPYQSSLSEDYYIIELNDVLEAAGEQLSSSAMLAQRGDLIAQIVRGELMPLSDGERREALQSSLSYYPNDLIVVGWVAAMIYDTREGAAPAIQLLEYANTQLLEYRHYDDLLTRVLADVYKYMDQRSLLRRWKMARKAAVLNTILLDVRELTERTDNAIKFLSDMFYARAYRVASERVGVMDYRNLVEQKLRTANGLYEFMINEFHQGRAFILELMVVAILIIELANVFWPR